MSSSKPVATGSDSDAEFDLVLVEEFDAIAIDVKLNAIFDKADSEPAKQAKYPAKEHARKVAKYLGVKEGIIYLPGLPTPLYEDSDMGPQFRQRRYFYYLGGADFEGCSVTYDIGNDSLILWVPYIDPRQVLWYGTSPGPEECLAKTDLDGVRYTKDLSGYLKKTFGLDSVEKQRVDASIGSSFCTDRRSFAIQELLATCKALPKPPTLYVLHTTQLPELFQASTLAKMITVDEHSLMPAMDNARVTKTPYEIEMIRKANDISSTAHRAVLEKLKGMTNERNIEATFVDHCLDVYGAKHQSYPVIAGSGSNAGVLHYFANDKPLAGSQVVCLDAGAEWELYASDVTRSFPISGTFTPEAASIYKIVEQMQEQVISRFKPGVPFRYLHLHAASVAAQGLLDLGILKDASVTDLLGMGTIAAFFPHGLGHHVGLEVHDVLSPDLMARASYEGEKEKDCLASRSTDPFEPKSLDMRNRMGGTKRLITTPTWYKEMTAEATAVYNGSIPSYESRTSRRRMLEAGMIITVEPGIYFCQPYIEAFFLKSPLHSKYINKDVLEKYYGVGGIRIEDCLLVTKTGYENLTTAPKGDEALKVINGN